MVDEAAPASETEVSELIRWALTQGKSLDIRGMGTKAGFGLPVDADCTVSLQGLGGILSYEPEEFIMTARAGTAIEQIDQALAANGQHLAFEPIRLGKLLDSGNTAGTVGGIFMGNLSGPRRFKSGAARDHILGVKAVNGRGESYKSGGAVLKNVTGYDLSKLLAGSWGTLSIVTEITFKVLPAPPTSTTVVVRGQDAGDGMATLHQLATCPLEISGLAYLPPVSENRSAIAAAGDRERAITAARLEGSPLSVRERTRDMLRMLPPDLDRDTLTARQSLHFWEAIRDVHSIIAPGANHTVLKASVPPGGALGLIEELERLEDCIWYFDAAGGWCWIGLANPEPGHSIVRLRNFLGENGSLVVYRAVDKIKRTHGIILLPDAVDSLSRRIRHAFDPRHIFNPGRLFRH